MDASPIQERQYRKDDDKPRRRESELEQADRIPQEGDRKKELKERKEKKREARDRGGLDEWVDADAIECDDGIHFASH